MPDTILAAISGNPLLKSPDVIIARDTFARGDAVLTGQPTPVGAKLWLTRAEAGSTWSAVIRGGRAGILSDTAGLYQLSLIDTGTPDCEFEIDFAYAEAGVTNSRIVVPFRVSDTGNLMMLTVTSGLWTLRKRVSGAFTTIVQSSVTATPGQRLKIVMKGSSIRIYVNGALIIDAIETAHMTRTMHGFGNLGIAATAPATEWDNVKFTIPGT